MSTWSFTNHVQKNESRKTTQGHEHKAPAVLVFTHISTQGLAKMHVSVVVCLARQFAPSNDDIPLLARRLVISIS